MSALVCATTGALMGEKRGDKPAGFGWGLLLGTLSLLIFVMSTTPGPTSDRVSRQRQSDSAADLRQIRRDRRQGRGPSPT